MKTHVLCPLFIKYSAFPDTWSRSQKVTSCNRVSGGLFGPYSRLSRLIFRLEIFNSGYFDHFTIVRVVELQAVTSYNVTRTKNVLVTLQHVQLQVTTGKNSSKT